MLKADKMTIKTQEALVEAQQLSRCLKAPSVECIDYVIIHELCHLHHHDHGPGFYRFLEKVMPDWEKRKHKLELVLS